jgi:Helix-turn-helix.
MTLGCRLKQLRHEKKLSQIEMAQTLGIATSTYQHYERDENEITQKVLTQLLTNFRLSPAWLLTGELPIFLSHERALPESNIEPIDEGAAELLKLYEGLDEEGRKEFLRMARKEQLLYTLMKERAG